MVFEVVAKVADISAGEVKKVTAGGIEIALINKGGSFYALNNHCVHKGGPLGEGKLEGENVVCPWHQWVYNVETGISPVNDQARVSIYPVKVEGEDIMVDVESKL